MEIQTLWAWAEFLGGISGLVAAIGVIATLLYLARQIPGVGLLGATALAALLGEDGQGYRNGREFAACLGLVPRHTGTGGTVRIGRLSKRGDPYIRTLLMHGARSVIFHTNHHNEWLERLLARRPFNVVVAALANKMARTAWALVAHDRDNQAGGFARAA